MRTVLYWVSVALLLYVGLAGLQGFFDDLDGVENLGQRLANVSQLLYGSAGLGAATGAILKRSWTGKVALVFAFGAGSTAGLASVFWGESGIPTGLASGGLGFLIGYLLYLGVRRAGAEDEGLPGPDSDPGGYPGQEI